MRGRAVDAVRPAAHLSHEARLVKSLASDAIDDAVHASKQAIKTVKRRTQDVADLHDEIVHLVRREPVKAVAVAFGAGILVGVVTGIAGLARYDRAYR
ncbi:MAG TPA: hypothetical protein VGQ16_18365 [Vicinamibacterales bacterium]|nr:hypothetical protein [Vicinamibacterales bacterium]